MTQNLADELEAPKPGMPLPWRVSDAKPTKVRGIDLLGGYSKSVAHVPIKRFVADTSGQDAAYIVHACNEYPVLTAERDALKAENERLREANGILEDGLQEVGDDYPGSNMQDWCQQQIKAARQALKGTVG